MRDGLPRVTLHREGHPRRFLWLKAVTGVDTGVHCAQALIGRYLPGVDRRADVLDVALPAAPAWYFCGVTDPFVWADNDHALLTPAPGHTDEVWTPGYAIGLQNVAAVPLSAAAIPFGARHAENPRYRTCRNWQAAHLLAAAGLPNRSAATWSS